MPDAYVPERCPTAVYGGRFDGIIRSRGRELRGNRMLKGKTSCLDGAARPATRPPRLDLTQLCPKSTA